MLKRPSETNSPGYIEGHSTASATHCSHHSSCNSHTMFTSISYRNQMPARLQFTYKSDNKRRNQLLRTF